MWLDINGGFKDLLLSSSSLYHSHLTHRQWNLLVIPTYPPGFEQDVAFSVHERGETHAQERKRKHGGEDLLFTREIRFTSPVSKRLYNELKKADLIFEEPLDFNNINYPHLWEPLTYAGLFKYLTTIKTSQVQLDEVVQFYTRLYLEQSEQRLRFHTLVNNEKVVIKESDIIVACGLPDSRLRLANTTCLETLPFACSQEEFWNTLSHRYNPRGREEM